MPYYRGPDGRIYNRPVTGGTLVSGGDVPPPPRTTAGYDTPRPPVAGEAGFFRKTLFWLFSLGSSLGAACAMGEFLCTQVLCDSSLDGIVGGVSGMLLNAAPIILYVTAFLACLVIGVGAGDDHNYNLAALLITVFGSAGICLIAAVGLALLPYAVALLAILFGFGLLIGVIAGIFGG